MAKKKKSPPKVLYVADWTVPNDIIALAEPDFGSGQQVAIYKLESVKQVKLSLE